MSHELEKVTTTYGSRKLKVTMDPGADLKIGADLTKAMADQPGLYAFYASLAEEAEGRAKNIKYQLHCKEEDLDKVFRKKAIASGEKFTESGLKNKVNRHPEMRALYEQYLEARRTAGKLTVLKDAFRQRADMLRSIGANRRSEVEQGEFQTLKQKAKRVLSNE